MNVHPNPNQRGILGQNLTANMGKNCKTVTCLLFVSTGLECVSIEQRFYSVKNKISLYTVLQESVSKLLFFCIGADVIVYMFSAYRLRKKNVETPFVVNISLLDGHVSPSERQRAELATVTTERWYMAPGVKRIEIRQNGIVGTLFLPPGENLSVMRDF